MARAGAHDCRSEQPGGQATSSSVAGGATASISANCPSGKKIVGAAAYWQGSDTPIEIFPSGGTSTTIWTAFAVNPGGSTDHIDFRVVCVTTS